jgi:hypothetical protein
MTLFLWIKQLELWHLTLFLFQEVNKFPLPEIYSLGSPFFII